MKRYTIILIFLAVLLTPMAAVAQTMDSKVDASANATLIYAPETNYEGTKEKRFYPNGIFPHLMHPQQAPLPKGFDFFYFKPLANAIKIYNWSGEPDSENVWCVDYFRIPDNKNPIEWVSAIPADDNTILLGYVGIKGKRNEQEAEVVKRAIHNAKYRFGTSRIQVAKRSRQEAAQWGASIGSGGAYGQVLDPSHPDREKLMVLNAGAILGYSEHWIREYADVIVYAYSDAIAEAAPIQTAVEAPASESSQPKTTPFLRIGRNSVFFNHNEAIILPTFKHLPAEYAKDIKALKDQGFDGVIYISGWTDPNGTEIYNAGVLGPARGTVVCYAIMVEGEKIGLSREWMNSHFVIVSAGEINKHNPKYYFNKYGLDRRTDVVAIPAAYQLTELPSPDFQPGTKEKGEK